MTTQLLIWDKKYCFVPPYDKINNTNLTEKFAIEADFNSLFLNFQIIGFLQKIESHFLE